MPILGCRRPIAALRVLEHRGRGRIRKLAADALDKWLDKPLLRQRAEHVQGHMDQVWGALQGFLRANPRVRLQIRRTPLQPFQVQHYPAILDSWVRWLRTRRNDRYGPRQESYSYRVLRNCLSRRLGGVHTTGTSGDLCLKLLLRIVVERDFARLV